MDLTLPDNIFLTKTSIHSLKVSTIHQPIFLCDPQIIMGTGENALLIPEDQNESPKTNRIHK